MLGTLNHILVGDIIWLKRFATHHGSSDVLKPVALIPKPEKLDRLIIDWVENLSEADLGDLLAYSDTKGDPYQKPFGSLISHLFLHQIHYRGQVSALLSQLGVDFGDTDIIEIIPEP